MKRNVSCFLFILSMCSFVCSYGQTEPYYYLGDVNGDGIVDVSDAEFVSNMVLSAKQVPLSSVVSTTSSTDSSAKKIILGTLGDSLTEGWNTDVCYADLLKEYLGADKLCNYGVGGSCIAENSDVAVESFSSRCSNISDDVNLLLILGGTNDFLNGVPLGNQWTTDSDGTRTLNTTSTDFYGALNKMMSDILAKFSTTDKEVYLMTPIHCAPSGDLLGDLERNEAGYYLEDYVQAIKNVGANFGIPVIDLFATSGLNPNVEANRQAFFNHKWKDTDGQILPTIPDCLHPDANGHEKIFKTIIKYLK